MMVAVRPEMIQTLHLMSQSLNKPAPGVNPPDAPKNRYVERVFWMPARLTFAGCSAIFDWYLVEVRIPLVAGRAFPISSDARAKGASAVDPPKSPRQLNAERLGARAKTCPLSSVVKLCGWSAIEE
jgi:hypothetical protein